MSDYERRKGTLTLLEDLEVGDFESFAKDVLGAEKPEYYETFLEYLMDEGYYEYKIINDKMYKISYQNINVSDDFYEATMNDDGTIDFDVQYYNGGCSMTEAIDTAIQNNKLIGSE